MKQLIASMLVLFGVSFGASAQEIRTELSVTFKEKLSDDYGHREAGLLVEKLEHKLRKELEKEGANVDRIILTLEDAKPNRPTFEQMSAQPGLDPIRSISIGGARVSGIALDAEGNEIASLSYDWYSSSISDVFGAGVWSDANRAFGKFSRRFVKRLP